MKAKSYVLLWLQLILIAAAFSGCQSDAPSSRPVIDTETEDVGGEVASVFDSANLIREGNSLVVLWSEVADASSYNLYVSETSDYSHDDEAQVFENVASPFRIPAAFNEYTNHYFTVVGVSESSTQPYRTLSSRIRDWSESSSRGCATYEYSVWCFNAVGFTHEDTGQNVPIPQVTAPGRIEVSNDAGCVLDGTTVRCWSENDHSHIVRYQNNIENVTDFTLAHTVGCYIRDGEIQCWGYPFNIPSDIPLGVSDAQRIFSDGGATFCATGPSGIACWGRKDSLTMQVPNVLGVTQIAFGSEHACAVAEGEVVCWGDNTFDQLSAPAMSGVTQIAIANDQTCALHQDGVSCWGNPRMAVDEFNIPPPRSLPANVYGMLDNSKGGICVLDDGMPICWGDKVHHPILHNDATVTQVDAFYISGQTQCVLNRLSDVETRISCYSNEPGLHFAEILSGPVDFGLGYKFACALIGSGVRCWGQNPTIPDLDEPTKISIGNTNVCVLDGNDAKCWGSSFDKPFTTTPLVNPTDVSVNWGVACAIDRSEVVCWTKDGVFEPEVTVSNPSILKNHCVKGDEGISCFSSEPPYKEFTFVDAPNAVDFVSTGAYLRSPSEAKVDIFTLKHLENATAIFYTQSQDACIKDSKGLICAGYNYFLGAGWRFTPPAPHEDI